MKGLAETRTELLERAVELAVRVGHVFIATADADGKPSGHPCEQGNWL